ncbi:MAG: hypothetical protein ABJA78_16695 [Ferruginibacter sp.]
MFRAANLFAKSIIADPALKALYAAKAKRDSNAYLTAVSEYMQNCLKENVAVGGRALRCFPCNGTQMFKIK